MKSVLEELMELGFERVTGCVVKGYVARSYQRFQPHAFLKPATRAILR